MSIIRAPRPEQRFYILDKRISEDARLSWAARGLLVFILGKPDNWRISVEQLIEQTQSSARPTGRDGIYGLLQELITAGYVERVQRRRNDGSGTFDKVDYLVHETPVETSSENPSHEKSNKHSKPSGEQPIQSESDNDKEIMTSPLTAEPDTAEPEAALYRSKQVLKVNKEPEIQSIFYISPELAHETNAPTVSTAKRKRRGSGETEDKKRRRHTIPDDFALTQPRLAYALSKGLSPQKAQENFERFVLHHRSKGTLHLDWDCAWRYWVLRSKEFEAARRPQDTATTRFDPHDESTWGLDEYGRFDPGRYINDQRRAYAILHAHEATSNPARADQIPLLGDLFPGEGDDGR